MHAIKQICTAALLVALAGAVAAHPVGIERAARVAQSFWNSHIATGVTLTPAAASDWPYTGLYLFTAPGGGFVIVAADDAAEPILGYSPSATMPPQGLPIPLQECLQNYQRQLLALQAADRAVVHNSQIAAKWQLLENQLPLPTAKSDSVEPLLTTVWDQDEPYNNLCPPGCVTGCAATALSQLMKYWNYPPFGRGTHGYVHDTYGLIHADFGHTLYDWDSMPDTATLRSTARQQTAVATLMYHVGITLDMMYNTPEGGGSAAVGLSGMPGQPSMENSLIDYFHYSPAMRVIFKDQGFTDQSWKETLMAELDLHHPILYTGLSEQGGHGFVCDGYDQNGLFHFNFGWSGRGNGYYAVGAITPPIGPNGEFGHYDFSRTNQALLGAVPLFALCANDSVKAFAQAGGTDSVYVALNPQNPASPTVENPADWLTLTVDTARTYLRLMLTASPNNTGVYRETTLLVRQGTETLPLRIMQDNYGVDDYCPITVVMTSRRGNGWLGNAHLTLQSEGGQVFGIAQLSGKSLDSVVIPVSPRTLHCVWTSGGGTDRYAGYTVKDAYGNIRAHVDNAYLETTDFIIGSPCTNAGIDSKPDRQVSLYPNPTSGTLFINTSGTPVRQILITAPTGQRAAHIANPTNANPTQLDLSALNPGVYYVQIFTDYGSSVHKIAIR